MSVKIYFDMDGTKAFDLYGKANWLNLSRNEKGGRILLLMTSYLRKSTSFVSSLLSRESARP